MLFFITCSIDLQMSLFHLVLLFFPCALYFVRPASTTVYSLVQCADGAPASSIFLFRFLLFISLRCDVLFHPRVKILVLPLVRSSLLYPGVAHGEGQLRVRQ